jgi:peroxiredoxin
MQGRRFVVVAVNVGEGARAARAFGEKMQLGFPLLLDSDTKTARAWSARVLPASFVIGPQGDIRYSYFGAIDWARDDVRKAIEALLR